MSRGRRAYRAQEQKADGRLVPAVTYVSSTDVDRLEKMLRDAVFRKVRTGVSGLLSPLNLYIICNLHGKGAHRRLRGAWSQGGLHQV